LFGNVGHAAGDLVEPRATWRLQRRERRLARIPDCRVDHRRAAGRLLVESA